MSRRDAGRSGAGAGGENRGPRPTEILCIARLAPVKGHAILFQAVAELGLRGHEVRVTLAGDGPMREELRRVAEVLGISARVKFLGNVGQDVIHTHYAQADVFVLPSFAEGVPVVLMEAMAARCPVIATRIAGIPELIEHTVTGLLVNPGRADFLADAVERILVNPRAAERMALAGQEKVRRDFNIHTVAPQLAGIFVRALAKGARGRETMVQPPETREEHSLAMDVNAGSRGAEGMDL